VAIGVSGVRAASELIRAIGGRVVRAGRGEPAGVSIDTRTLAPGDLFFALRGPNFDGHAFVGEALARVAWGAVVEEGAIDDAMAGATESAAARAAGASGAGAPAWIAVPDATRALQEMGRARRADLDIPFVAVTGSVGKTTTKEMIACALSAGFRVTRTEGNLNNHLGVPLSLLRAPADATAAVYELAMSAPGEIRFLAELVRPVVGIVTNVAAVHLESMSSLEAIARAKAELVEALPAGGAALLNWDDERVRAMAPAARAQVLSYGFSEGARLRAERVHLDDNGTVFEVAGGGSVRIPAWGRHLVYAGLAALGAAELLGISAIDARDALRRFRPAPSRSQFRPLGLVRLLDDSYNASPLSVRAAVDALCDRPGGGARIVVLGDMLELGPSSEAMHEELGRDLAARRIDLLIAYGPLSAAIRRGAVAAGLRDDAAHHFASHAEIAAFLRARLSPGDHLLVKGSRGMKMEEVIRLLESDLPAAIRPAAD